MSNNEGDESVEENAGSMGAANRTDRSVSNEHDGVPWDEKEKVQ